MVLLVGTHGQLRLPLACRVGKKGGPSTFDWALAWRSSARHRLTLKPRFVLFEAWYPAKRLLKRLREYGWSFVCQVKKHRPFEGMPWQRYRRQPYWQAVGLLSGGLKVRVVKSRRQDYATNR